MSRINMSEGNTNSIPYVAFDAIVNYKPTAGVFNLYLTEAKEVKEVKEISGALITRRNVVLASSKTDKPVVCDDFDSFKEKLNFRETVKGGQVIAKGLEYAEARDNANKYFLPNSFRLATALYLVTEKGAIVKLVLTGTTRAKVNEQLDSMSDIDFLNVTVEADTITVGAGSRSQVIYPLALKESKKEYSRDIINKINSVVDTLKRVKEYKRTGKIETATVNDAEEIFESKEVDDLPI